MGDAIIIIKPYVFDFLFSLIIFIIGVDFTWSGIVLIRENDLSRIPKFFGYLLIKLTRRSISKWESRNPFMSTVVSIKYFGIYFILSGPLLIIVSALMIIREVILILMFQ